MALVLKCDGCQADIPLETTPIGRLVEAYYCGPCRAVYERADAEVDAVRVRLATQFERERGKMLTAARKKLKKLPDE